jgi:FkbM family methyltransferase
VNIARLVRALPRPLRRHRLVRALLRLSPGSAVQEVRFNGGARLVADISDPFPRAYLLSGVFEPEFFTVATPFLRRGGAFLDVGANVGFCSFGLMQALAAGPPVDFHLFEANPRLCALLRRSAALHPVQSVTVVHGCVTSARGVSRLRVVPDQLGASYIAEDGEEVVPNVVLDEYLEARGIERVPLMKMDIEGLEPMAIEGARRSLSSGRIESIYLEVSAPNLARRGLNPAATLSALGDAGFEVFFVREADLRRGDDTRTRVLEVAGAAIRARAVDEFPPNHQTDVLAVHRSSSAVRAIRQS